MARKRKTDSAEQTAQPKRGRGRPKKELKNAFDNPDAIAACFSEYSSLMADNARIGQRIAAMFRRYEKADGVDSKSIKRAYSIAQQNPEIAAERHRRDQEYLRILGIIEFDDEGQGNFTAGLTSEEKPAKPAKPIVSMEAQQRLNAARAYTDGYNSGLAGGTEAHNKHNPGTERHVKWLEGLKDGQADRAMKNPDALRTVQANDRRERREPKQPDPEVVKALAKEITEELSETETVH